MELLESQKERNEILVLTVDMRLLLRKTRQMYFGFENTLIIRF